MSNVLSKLSGWVGALACASLLAACGGGGGSPGSTPGNPDPTAPTAASIVVTASAATIASSGQDGTEVTLTAIVKDGNSRAVPNAKVVFKASSGSISTSTAVTDSNGVMTEKLSTKGDSSLRDIKISASVNGVTSNEIVVKVVQATQTLTLTTDSGTLASAGAAGAEVTVTALVRDSNNSVMPGVRVELSADSGSLTTGTRVTDAQGRVSEKLSTGGDATSRTIKVTGSIPGVAPVTANVPVVGTTLQVTANSTVNVATSTDVSVKLTDSAGNALINKPVTFSSGANTLAVKGGAAVTNAAGQLTLSYTATSVPQGGKDIITVRAMGEVASTELIVSSANFTVKTVSGAVVANINSCVPLLVHSDNGGVNTVGSVMVSSSRGTVYTDDQCINPQTAAVALSSGNAVLYLKATSPGAAILTANIVNGGTTQGALEFVAPLLPSATITLQSDPAVVGTNTAGSNSQQATIRAVVRDGTAANNLVKNALVTFSIVSDASGGSLSQPALVATGADGAASVSYVAGTAPTALNGVVIRAQLQGASSASTTTSLTVSKKSLFISAGAGRDVGVSIPTAYTKDYTVIVTDASGNAVPGVNVTASVLPRHYRKGVLQFLGADGPWQLPLVAVTDSSGVVSNVLPYACLNEDANKNGVLEAGEDRNGNGRLDPGIPVTVTSNVTTDANGRAVVTLTYPRDRAQWLGVDLFIRGQVSGSEATYVAYIPILPGAAPDYSDRKVDPPGVVSPYGQVNTGTVADCSNAN